jgi:cell division protein FtsB
MAKNRKNQAAEVRLAPVLKVVLLCALIGGSAIGYVWQKSQIDRLGHQIADREVRLNRLKGDNKTLSDQIAVLKSPPMIDRRVKELNLGLAPVQPLQVVRLAEPRAEAQVMAGTEAPPQYAQRPASDGTQQP